MDVTAVETGRPVLYTCHHVNKQNGQNISSRSKSNTLKKSRVTNSVPGTGRGKSEASERAVSRGTGEESNRKNFIFIYEMLELLEHALRVWK